MRRSLRLPALLLALIISACGGKSNKDLIIGKWDFVDQKGMVEFQPDGKFKMTLGGTMSIQGTYQFSDGSTVEMKGENPVAALMPMAPQETREIKRIYKIVSLGESEMNVTDQQGKSLKAKRIQ